MPNQVKQLNHRLIYLIYFFIQCTYFCQFIIIVTDQEFPSHAIPLRQLTPGLRASGTTHDYHHHHGVLVLLTVVACTLDDDVVNHILLLGYLVTGSLMCPHMADIRNFTSKCSRTIAKCECKACLLQQMQYMMSDV